MTLIIDVSPATARKISADPEALRRVAIMVEAAFGERESEIEETLLSREDEAALDEAYLAIQEGRVHPFHPETARTKAKELFHAA